MLKREDVREKECKEVVVVVPRRSLRLC